MRSRPVSPPVIADRGRSLGAALGSLDDLATTSTTERLGLARVLKERLGEGFEPCEVLFGAAGLFGVRHLATGVAFVAIPGGSFRMGLSLRDVEDMAVHVHPDNPGGRAIIARLKTEARPARRVALRPFLGAEVPVVPAVAARWFDGFGDRAPFVGVVPGLPVALLSPGEARLVREVTGFRLLSEAEFEYAASEGGRTRWVGGWDQLGAGAVGEAKPDRRPSGGNAFGLTALGYGEWVADGWHPTYRGAPRDGRAWDPRPEPETHRASGGLYYPWQDASEILTCHVAWRDRAGRVEREPRYPVRFALDLPLDA